MKYVFGILFVFILNGCVTSDVVYNVKNEKDYKKIQYYENSMCRYMVGPFTIGDELDTQKLIKATIKKANQDGLYGDKLVNIKFKQGGYTSIIVSKLCLYISGNLIYSEEALRE